ncbi:hypothetical protein SLE2022_137220 [Rubroshorea leprosula]
MTDISPLDSSLPWLWIIEYLASFEQVDTDILHDLIERAPDLPDDLGKNTRERVALRCLEVLFNPIDRLANDVTPASRVCFDLSQSCEDVLQCILQEKSVSDLKNTRPELLRWDLYPFIMHKRATLPKCALEELKDTILSRCHPYAAALKEISGLVHNKTPDGIIVSNDHHNALTLRLCEGRNNGQTVPEKSNAVPPILENGNRMRNLLPLKRGRSELATKNLAGLNNGSLLGHNNDLQLNAKMLKQGNTCTSPSVGQISIPLLVGDASERVIRVTEVDCSVLHEESRVGEHCNDDNLGNVHNASKICENIVGDGSVQFVTADETHNGELRSLAGAPLTRTQQQFSVEETSNSGQSSKLRQPNTVSAGEMQQSSNPCESSADTCHPCEDEMLSNNDEFLREGMDIAMKKIHFLSSHCTASQDPLGTAGWTEQNLCVKCNKDGQMLVCSTTGCPLVFHESCLGSWARFDDKGNFHCPFCAYSLSISEYLEAKKKECTARKELSALTHMFEHCSPELTGGHRKEKSSRLKGKDFLVRIEENGHLREKEQNPTNHNGEDANHQFQRSLADKHQSVPSMPCRDVNTPCMEVESNAIGGTACISTLGEEGKEKVVKESLSEREPERQGAQPSDIPDRKSGSPSCKNTETAPVNQSERIQKEILQQHVTNPNQQTIILNFDGEDTSDAETDKFIISSYSIRVRSEERKYTYPAIPQLRRKKVPWTIEEERMLREGVSKFASTAGGNVPWKEILDFGASVFLKCRTTVDLKDKWRNMCKGTPKRKKRSHTGGA